MTGLLSNAGRAFLRAFLGAVLPLAIGILAAPNLDQALLLATAALIAGLDAGIKTVQVFVPQLTTGNDVADAFLRAGISALLILLPGVYAAPNLETAKGALTALIVGIATALIRVAQGLFTTGESALGTRPAVATDKGDRATGFNVPDRAPLVARFGRAA